ncbi:uncharacterized protein LOC143276963 [Babylonia areolata]|uniref:uncharacterized protein LOC143276963 n=1 Tax=Babylonia areolata TaxID=304850 RepID=UPI003FD66377
MWYFQSVADVDRKFLLLPGKQYVLGRRDCDIVIENDQSVSRKHAILSVQHPDANVSNVNKPATLTLEDVSKFGTHVNNQRIKLKAPRVLRDGDEVRFGTPKSLHRVVFEPFIITTSCVDGAGKKEVRALVCHLGGHVSSDWQKDCRFLIMKSITVTIKVVCALVSQKPIVTVDYLRDLVQFYKGQKVEKPQPENYLPPVTERLVEPGVSFHVNAKRSTVFLGMSFYFLSEKQFQKMNMAVEEGGGVPILCDDPQTADLEGFLEEKTVVMNPAPGELVNQAQRDWVEKVRSYLTKRSKFMAQDAEIGYAALYASTDTYCNPDMDSTHLLPGALTAHSQTASLSTQSQSQLPPSSSSSHTHTRHTLAFRKPPPPVTGSTSARQPHGSSQKDSGLSNKAVVVEEKSLDSKRKPSSQSGEKVEEDKPQGSKRNQQSKSGEKEQAVFTVPESLTEDSVKVKSEKLGGDERSGPSVTEHLRSPHRVNSPFFSESQTSERKKAVTVKVEEEDDWSYAKREPQPSETVPDTVQSSSTVKKEEKDHKDRKPLHWLDDEDDDSVVHTRKPPPSRNKRKVQTLSEDDDDDDDPFHLIKKRPRKMVSPEPDSSSTRAQHQSPEPEVKPKITSSNQKAACIPAPESHHSATESQKQRQRRCKQGGESSDEEEDNPFDFVSKKQAARDPPARSNKRQAGRSPSPTPSSKKEKTPRTRRSPSPRTRPKRGTASRREEESEDSDLESPPSPVNKRVTRRSPSPNPNRPNPETATKKEEKAPRSPSLKTRPKRGATSRTEDSEDSDLELLPSPVNKRVTRRSPSPKPSRSSAEPTTKKTDDARKSPTPKPSRSSPEPTRARKSDDEARPAAEGKSSSASSQNPPPPPSAAVSADDRERSDVSVTSFAPVPAGFLTTRKPIEEQVRVNPDFEKENIDAPAMVVQFEDLVVHRRNRGPVTTTRSDDVPPPPPGTTRWKGRVVPNFKKFAKVQHAGADRLPRIIGGRDLEEHSRCSSKLMDEWLKDLTDAESQQQQKDKEAQRLFEWRPAPTSASTTTTRGRKSAASRR